MELVRTSQKVRLIDVSDSLSKVVIGKTAYGVVRKAGDNDFRGVWRLKHRPNLTVQAPTKFSCFDLLLEARQKLQDEVDAERFGL